MLIYLKERGDIMPLLAVDTSSDLLSVALLNKQHIATVKNNLSQSQHGVLLLPKIKELLSTENLSVNEIEGIVIGIGPGSYTGLRIGITAAKMWGVSKNIPVYPVSSLAVMASVVEGESDDVVIVPIVDARRNTVYTGIYQYDKNNNLISLGPDVHSDWLSWLGENIKLLSQYQKVVFVGYHIEHLITLVKQNYNELKMEVIDSEHALPMMERAFKLIKDEVDDISLLSPNYAQLTLAEREWIEKSEQVINNEKLVDTTIN